MAMQTSPLMVQARPPLDFSTLIRNYAVFLLVSKGIVRMLYHTVSPLKNASFSVHTHI